MKKKAEPFAGKYQKPDSEDPNTINHMIWYEATNYARPFPGEKEFLPRATSTKPHPPKRMTTTISRSRPQLQKALSAITGRGLFVFVSIQFTV